MKTNDIEIALHGGEINSVVRVGETVRRTGGFWTPTIHALLNHVEAAGFRAAPRAVGFDERGREILSFIDGDVTSGNKPLPDYIWKDSTLVAVAKLLRQLHDATASFEVAKDAKWWWPVNNAPGARVICHNDFAPWNIVFRNNKPVGVIDWDLAAPGPATSDIAWTLWFFVPLRSNDMYKPALSMTLDDRAMRLRLFCDAYGLGEKDRRNILGHVLERHDEVVTAVAHLARYSEGYRRLRDEAREDMNRDKLFVQSNFEELGEHLHVVAEMRQADVVEFLVLCESNGIEVWLDGGWGVDALLQKQTRKHEDLDIVVEKKHVQRLRSLLKDRGYHDAPWYESYPWVFLLEDSIGHRVDVHVIELAPNGDGLYAPPDNYPAESLAGRGVVGAVKVRCISPEWQIRFHSGYKLDDNDHHDLRALSDRFDIRLPKTIPEHGTRWQALGERKPGG